MTKQKLSITPTHTYHSNHQAPDIIPSLPYTHHHISLTVTIQNISQEYKHQNRSQKSPETIKEPKERHHTKISFVKTSVSQSKYTANGSKKNTVQENTMCCTTPVIHQQLPKQHYHTLQVSSKPKPERTAPDACTPLLTLPS